MGSDSLQDEPAEEQPLKIVPFPEKVWLNALISLVHHISTCRC